MDTPLVYPIQSIRLHARVFTSAYSFPPHRLPSHQFYCVLAGELSYRVETRAYRLKANEAVWIAPGLEREPGGVARPGRYLVVEFVAPSSCRFPAGGEKRALDSVSIAAARALADLGTVTGDEHRASVLFHHLCLHARPDLLLAGPASSGDERSASRSDQALASRVERIERMMAENTARPLRLEELAGLAGMSRSALARLFIACRGRPPCARFREIRLERARHLLVEGGRTVTEVAMATGFASSQHFAGAFRRRFGTTPSAHAAGAADERRVFFAHAPG